MAANDTIQSIKIGIGLDAKGFVESAREAKRELDRAVPARMERFLTLRAKVDPSLAQVDNVSRQIEKRLNDNLKRALVLTPKFTVSGKSVTDLQKSINDQLKTHKIEVPITIGKIDGAAVRKQILDAIGVPSIPFTWHWQGEPPPGGAVPAGGAPRRGGGGGAPAAPPPAAPPPTEPAAPATGGRGRRATPPPAAVVAPTPAEPAPLTRQPRPARGRVTPPQATAVPTPVVQTEPTPRMSIDELRGRPVTYTKEELLTHLYERELPIKQRAPQTRGVRGAGRAGVNVYTPEDLAILQRAVSPEEAAIRAAQRERADKMAAGFRVSAALKRRQDPDYQRARNVVRGLRGIKYDAQGFPDITTLQEAMTQSYGAEPGGSLAEAWWHYLMGDLQGAGAMATEALKSFRPFSGIKRAGRKMTRVTDPTANPEAAPADVLVFHALAKSLQSEELVSENANAAVRKATRQGKTFNRGGGFVTGIAADEKYYRRLRGLIPDLTGPEPEMTGETILTTGAGVESIAEAQALAATKRKAPASERRRRAKSAADNFARRMDRANALGMTIQEFMQTDEGKRMIERRAWGGPVGSPKVDKYYRNVTGVLEKIFPFAAIDVRGIHPENLNQMVESAHHMSALFPETARSLLELRGFTPEERKGFIAARGQRPPLMATGPVFAPTATGYTQMGTQMWYDRGRLTEPVSFRKAHAQGWSTARDMRDIFTHEFGHAVAFNSPEAFVLDAHRAGNLRSQYGMSNKDEYWAEAFAKFHRGEDVGPAIRRSILDAMAGERGLPMSWVKRLDEYAAGGKVPKHGIYQVGERGRELFVPEEAGWIIPNHLMDQLPKREAGGGVRPLQYRGRGGRYTSGAAAATAAMVAGIASPANAMPVAVVNWPPAFVSPQAQNMAARGNVQNPQAQALAAALGGNVAGGLTPLAGGFSMRATALTRQQARAQASDFADVFASRLTQARTNVSEAMQMTPARALSVMFGQIAQVRFGGRAGILERRDVASRAIEQANREVGAMRTLRERNLILREQRNAAVQAGAPQADIDAINQDLGIGLRAQLSQSRRARRFTAAAEARSSEVVTRGDVVRSAGVGLLGIIGGTVAFTAAMHIAQGVITVFSDITEKSIDALSGFALTANRVTSELASAVQQGGGGPAARGIVAARAAQIGLPAGFDLTALTDRARIEAGNKNLQDVLDFMRASAAVTRQNALGGGAVPGLSQTTGGLNILGLQTPFGGTASTAELITGALTGPTDVGNTLWMNQIAATLGLPFGQRRPLGRAGPLQGDELQATADAMIAGNEEIFRNFNALAEKAGDQYGQILTDQGQAAVDATRQAWLAAGLNPAQVSRITVGGRSLQGISTRPEDAMANRQIALNFLQGVNTGAGMPTREFIQDTLLKPLSGQLARIELTGQRQRETRIPTDIALSLRRQPQLAPTTGLMGATSQDTANLTAYVDEVARYQQITQDLADDTWLEQLPPQAQAAVETLTQLGSEIAAMQTRMANIQTGFANEQWMNQQKLALRQAGDMVGLLGEQERSVRVIVDYDERGNAIFENRIVQAEKLGQLQRQQIDLSRENQRIEFSIQQREINFQRAVAGIEVPGRTPGEQQAFVDAANRRAREAQEALDRQQGLFNLGVEIEDINLSRQAEDFLNITLPEMFQGHAVEVETRGLSAAISEAQRAQGAIDAFVESFKTEQVAFEDAIFDAWLTTETEMNSFADRYEDTVREGLDRLSQQYSAFMQGTYVPGQGTQTGTGTGTTIDWSDFPQFPGQTYADYVREHSFARGAYDVKQDQMAMIHRGEMIIPAHVANWMRGSSYAGGSGGNTVVIQINNPVVRDDSDIDKLARKVEQVMNRRAISIGVLTNN